MPSSLDVVLPVHNEQAVLRSSVERLHAHVHEALPELEVQITIADNASTDQTDELARALCAELPGVRLRRLEERGRGRALRAAWGASEADLVAYMDVDLSTDLAALAPLVRPLLAHEADIAVGSRLAPGSEVERSLKRELMSRTYNMLVKRLLHVRFTDAQCGFKAARRESLLPILGEIENQNWFFDTELLYIAQQKGLTLFELPVHWVEDGDSSVHLAATVIEDLLGIRRLRRGWRGSGAGPSSPRRSRRGRDRHEPGVGTTRG
jgi:glycosyltransferase involved in cell wall biosynthesis